MTIPPQEHPSDRSGIEACGIQHQTGGVAAPTIDGERGDAKLTRLRPPVLWCRGDEDEVIAADDVRRLSEFLPTHSTLKERIYTGVAHTVPSPMVADVTRFLQEQARRLDNSRQGA